MTNTVTTVLRPYQIAAIEAMRAQLRAGRRRLALVAPTGSGKTSIAAEMIRSALDRSKRVLFLAHRRELLDQCHGRLAEFGVDASIIRADDPRIDRANPVQLASVQTLVRRLDKEFAQEAFDLIVVDECHHVRADSYGKILARFFTASAVIGLTATPCRKDGRGLGEAFDNIIQAASIRELTELGFLVKPRMYTSPDVDLRGIRTHRGDYSLGELGDRMNTNHLVGNIIDEWRRLASDRTTVVFATTVAHSRSIAQRFQQVGVNAEHIDGMTPEGEREAALERVRSGESQVVVNCQILTEGWDMPAVACCVLARPTKSLALYLQMAGRALRPALGKTDCIILDHGNNVRMHGAVDRDRKWSLSMDKAAGESGECPEKECPECGVVLPAATRTCPDCGHEFPLAVRGSNGIELDTRLVEANDLDIRREAFFAIVELVRQSTRRDGTPYKLTAAVAKYKESFNEWPNWSWQREAGIR